MDLYWADILKEYQEAYASTTERWTQALLNRLKEPFTPKNWTKPWLIPLLEEVEATVIPVKRVLSLYKKSIADHIFNDIIGDIHLYGDFARTRGRAVRRFHATLDQIVLRDFE